MTDSPSVTIVTIAQNEEAKIAACIASCHDLGRHVVVDGGSADRTVEVAEAAGAVVIHRRFRYPADQYNFGIDTATTPWVLVLDADERLDETLHAEIFRVTRMPPSGRVAAYAINRKNHVFGKWLRHGSWYPDYNIRLLDRRRCRYEDREVHARLVLPNGAAVARLPGHVVHITYDSVEQYLNKLNRFTTREVLAREKPSTSRELRARVRRIWLRTPLRPLSKFGVEYLVKSGWRDGRLGFDMAVLSAMYEFVVGVKQREKRRSGNRTS